MWGLKYKINGDKKILVLQLKEYIINNLRYIQNIKHKTINAETFSNKFRVYCERFYFYLQNINNVRLTVKRLDSMNVEYLLNLL